MAFTINNTQEQPLGIVALDGLGGSIPATSYARTWQSSNTAVVVTGTAPDGQVVAAAVPGATGSAVVTLNMTRTDGSIASASQNVTVNAAPPPLPASVQVSVAGSPRPRTLP